MVKCMKRFMNLLVIRDMQFLNNNIFFYIRLDSTNQKGGLYFMLGDGIFAFCR